LLNIWIIYQKGSFQSYVFNLLRILIHFMLARLQQINVFCLLHEQNIHGTIPFLSLGTAIFKYTRSTDCAILFNFILYEPSLRLENVIWRVFTLNRSEISPRYNFAFLFGYTWIDYSIFSYRRYWPWWSSADVLGNYS